MIFILSMKNSVGNAEHTTTAIPSIKIDEKLRNEILAQVEEEGVVIIHCSFSTDIDTGVRIWKTTVLVEEVQDSFGFEIFDIKRNSTDVYNVNVSDA